jgi:hypothetical protein
MVKKSMKNIYLCKTTYFVLCIKQDTILALLFIFNDSSVQGNDPLVFLLLTLKIAIYGQSLRGFGGT